LLSTLLFGLSLPWLSAGCGGGPSSVPEATVKQNMDDELKAMENAEKQGTHGP
ncbi:MAG: hypothetical protein IRY99_25450, partial [Isosphaeraceae bacterium]|nr:hypothetical protein [Isosphaeraceae bacterium]